MNKKKETKMNTANPNKVLDRQISALNRKKLVIESLKQKRQTVIARYDEKISALIGGDAKIAGNQQRIRELPRGVLTLVLTELLKENKKPMAVSEVIEKAKSNKLLSKATDIAAKVRNILNTSSHFSRTDRGVYKLKNGVSGHLFDRLKKETNLVAA